LLAPINLHNAPLGVLAFLRISGAVRGHLSGCCSKRGPIGVRAQTQGRNDEALAMLQRAAKLTTNLEESEKKAAAMLAGR
jgi:hypothetical protein